MRGIMLDWWKTWRHQRCRMWACKSNASYKSDTSGQLGRKQGRKPCRGWRGEGRELRGRQKEGQGNGDTSDDQTEEMKAQSKNVLRAYRSSSVTKYRLFLTMRSQYQPSKPDYIIWLGKIYPDVVSITASFTEPVLEVPIRKLSRPCFLNFTLKISSLNSSR